MAEEQEKLSREYYRQRQLERTINKLIATFEELGKNRIAKYAGWKKQIEAVKDLLNLAYKELTKLKK